MLNKTYIPFLPSLYIRIREREKVGCERDEGEAAGKATRQQFCGVLPLLRIRPPQLFRPSIFAHFLLAEAEANGNGLRAG